MLDLTLETTRLALRRVVSGDAAWITEGVGDPRVYLNLARVPAGQTLDQTRAFLAAMEAGHAAGTDHVVAILLDGAPIGCVGVHRRGPGSVFELGYWLRPEAWGQGLATEAAGALLTRISDGAGARAWVSGYFADNPASGRVLRKLGFLPCGRHKVFSVGRGEHVEHCDMSRID